MKETTETNLFKYYSISAIIVILGFTLVVPVIYHVITGDGWFGLIDKVMEKHHPRFYRNPHRRPFFAKW